jgi:hypothetical protein
MARYKKNEEEAFGSDSFLDIVANMVGIMIVLVMIAGLRAKHSAKAEAVADSPLVKDLELVAANERAIQGEIMRMLAESQALDALAASRKIERDGLAYAAVQAKAELDAWRKKLDASGQEEYDLRRAIQTRQASLERTALDIKATETTKPTAPLKIQTYQTPISHTVYNKEAHFQLKGGRIAYIPMDELVEALKIQARQQAYKLQEHPEVVDTIGPLGGFRLRYMLVRVDVPAQVSRASMGAAAYSPGGSYAQMEEFTLIPVADNLGETLENALQPRSEFLESIRGLDPKQTTVTLWTYPDSFGVYRSLKKELYALGFSIAGRPMPDGQHIGGSPHGSKSAAQ